MHANETPTVDSMIAALESHDVEVRTQARLRLMRMGAQVMEPLIAASKSQTQYQCWEATRVLAEMSDTRCMWALIEGLGHSEPLVGQIAASALGRYGDKAVTALLDILPRAPFMVQLQIARSLREINDLRAVEPLMDLLETTDSSVLRYTIVQTLGSLGDPVAVPLIKRFANDEDHHVRKRVRMALERLELNASQR